MDILRELRFTVHINNSNFSYTMYLPSFAVYSVFRRAIAMQFNINEDRIRIRTESYNNQYYAYNTAYSDVEMNSRIDSGVLIYLYIIIIIIIYYLIYRINTMYF